MGYINSNLPTLLSGVVTSMQATYPSLTFHYGHHKEVHKRLVDLWNDSTTKNDVFPFIVLFLDYEESVGDSGLYAYETSVNMAIVQESISEYTAEERQINVFQASLYPIYELFMAELKKSKHFGTDGYNNIPHTKIDRYFYSTDGAAEQNVFAAVADAIELRGLELKVFDNSNKC